MRKGAAEKELLSESFFWILDYGPRAERRVGTPSGLLSSFSANVSKHSIGEPHLLSQGAAGHIMGQAGDVLWDNAVFGNMRPWGASRKRPAPQAPVLYSACCHPKFIGIRRAKKVELEFWGEAAREPSAAQQGVGRSDLIS